MGGGGDRTERSGNSNAQDEKGKAIAADEVRLEMLEMSGEVGVTWTGRLLNVCMQEGRIPKERRMDLIVPTWKRKRDVHDPGNYRGITILNHNTQSSTETVGEGFSRNDQEKSM